MEELKKELSEIQSDYHFGMLTEKEYSDLFYLKLNTYLSQLDTVTLTEKIDELIDQIAK